MLHLDKVCLKSLYSVEGEKFHDWALAALNLQPSNLHLNTYWSPPGGKVFSPCFFHVSVSIETLESDSRSLSTSSRTEWILVYLLYYSTSADGL